MVGTDKKLVLLKIVIIQNLKGLSQRQKVLKGFIRTRASREMLRSTKINGWIILSKATLPSYGGAKMGRSLSFRTSFSTLREINDGGGLGEMGRGVEGLKAVIEEYKGVGGVYALPGGDI